MHRHEDHTGMYSHSRRSRFGRPGTGERIAAYLRSRTAEHWAFFAAGFVAAAILT